MLLHTGKRRYRLQEPWQRARPSIPAEGMTRDRERSPELTAAVPVTRNATGQSIDDARAEFRSAWESKLAQKKRDVARARRWIAALHRLTEVILIAGAIFGAIGGTALGVFSGNLAMFLEAVLLGAMIGCGATLPLGFLVQLPAWCLRWYAHRVERSINRQEPF